MEKGKQEAEMAHMQHAKKMMNRTVVTALMLGSTLVAAQSASAFDGQMPLATSQVAAPGYNILPFGQPERMLKTEVIRKGLMHPVDYWWYTDPAMSGKWDYATPVASANEPVEVLTKQTAYVRAQPTRAVYNHGTYNTVVNNPHIGPTPHNYVWTTNSQTVPSGAPSSNNYSMGHNNTWLGGSMPVRYVTMLDSRVNRHKATIYR
uniref:Uncharacterized protein n=1 Tax=Magnetococcus massalia (strain MO-1) TaxID=451514 RepID=A0A1S7LH15_MAGMO|nr:Conserved exported protein of unknown function [Candidatus Magnetococcus massalia]